MLIYAEHIPGDDCPTCKTQSFSSGHNLGINDSFDPSIHRGDKGVGGVVFTEDALHHGRGNILISKNKEEDFLNGKPTGKNLDNALKDAENQALSADIKAKEDLKEMKKLEKEIAEKRAHKARHEYEQLLAEKMRIENLKKKSPEIFSKQTSPVIVFPKNGFPFAHHLIRLRDYIQKVRQETKQRIEGLQKVAKLDDITEDLARANPHTTNPEDYVNIIKKSNTPEVLIDVPVSPENGKFFISPSSGGHAKGHSSDEGAHSNLPVTPQIFPPNSSLHPQGAKVNGYNEIVENENKKAADFYRAKADEFDAAATLDAVLPNNVHANAQGSNLAELSPSLKPYQMEDITLA